MTMTSADEAQLREVLDSLSEDMLVDLADSADDELVPIGRLLIEIFDAEERGYDYPADFAEMEMTAGELRERFRTMREQIAGEAA